MLSFYILGDDKPVLLNSKDNKNEIKFLETILFLEASAKIDQNVANKNKVKQDLPLDSWDDQELEFKQFIKEVVKNFIGKNVSSELHWRR